MKTDNETIDNAVRGDYLTDGDIIFISSGHPDPMKAVVGLNWLRNYIFFDEYCCLAVKENVRKATDAERISLDDVLRKQRLAWSQAEGKLKRTEQEASAVWPLISNCQPIIAGYGGTVTRMEDGDTRYDENFILRQHENGGWWIWQLVLPQFKVGDCIRAKGTNGEGSVIKAIDDEAGCYVFDHDVRGSYVCQEYELVPWEPRSGDIVRHKGDDVPFSPFLAMSEYLKARRAARVTPIYGKQRNAPHVPRVLGGCWTTDAYTKTIRAACMKAGITPWGANRLRHAFGTEVRRAFGLDAARAVLGHNGGQCVTDVYTFDALEDEMIRRAAPAVEALG